MINLSSHSFDLACEKGIMDLAVTHTSGGKLLHEGREFINMCSCSYLGLDTDLRVLEGAIKGIKDSGTLHLTTARTRLYTSALRDIEFDLSEFFDAYSITFNSCSAATSAFLPILASGQITGGKKPLMVFDRNCHFSMNHIKPICGDETTVVTIKHNDLEELERLCKNHDEVAYICDGTYSIEGECPLGDLQRLQEAYGLFLYIDDSHGMSLEGVNGQGRIATRLGNINSSTVIVASLAKAFGACGGVLVSGNEKINQLLIRHGSPWSQYLNSAGIGGIKASLEIHRSNEISQLQASWKENLSILDKFFPSANSKTTSPIRIITLDSTELAIECTQKLLALGFYVSAVYFPVVPRGKSGLRIMPRANVSKQIMQGFCSSIVEVCESSLIRSH